MGGPQPWCFGSTKGGGPVVYPLSLRTSWASFLQLHGPRHVAHEGDAVMRQIWKHPPCAMRTTSPVWDGFVTKPCTLIFETWHPISPRHTDTYSPSTTGFQLTAVDHLEWKVCFNGRREEGAAMGVLLEPCETTAAISPREVPSKRVHDCSGVRSVALPSLI